MKVFEYTDYRLFLKGYYEDVKSRNRRFSFQIFSQKAGFKNKGFLHNVIQGKKNLSKENAAHLAKAMGLNKHETQYFVYLVCFNQATKLKDRNQFHEEMSAIRTSGKEPWQPQIIRRDQFEYFSNVHNSVVRSLIGIHGFTGDYQGLAKKVRHRITPGQAKKSVQLLEKLGLIQKKNGNYQVINRTISTEKEVESLALQNFHLKVASLAFEAISELPKDQRNVQGATLGISRKTYEQIAEKITQFRLEIQRMAEEDKNANSVYRLNLQLFPLADNKVKRSRK